MAADQQRNQQRINDHGQHQFTQTQIDGQRAENCADDRNAPGGKNEDASEFAGVQPPAHVVEDSEDERARPASTASSMTKIRGRFPSSRLAGRKRRRKQRIETFVGQFAREAAIEHQCAGKGEDQPEQAAGDFAHFIRGGSKAKLKSSRMTMANAPAAFSDSLVRNSMARSLRATDSAWRNDSQSAPSSVWRR